MLIGLGWGWESLLHPASLSMHTHMQEHTCFLLQHTEAAAAGSWQGSPSPVCVSGTGKAATNPCGALVPPSWEIRGRSGSSGSSWCAPGALCSQNFAGLPRTWHWVKWSWTHSANEYSLPLFLWVLFSTGFFFFFLIRSFCLYSSEWKASSELAETWQGSLAHKIFAKFSFFSAFPRCVRTTLPNLCAGSAHYHSTD